MKKGSRSGYDAETGEEIAGSESSLGEPHEQLSLYRIRRSQENHQLSPVFAEDRYRQPEPNHERKQRQRIHKKVGEAEASCEQHVYPPVVARNVSESRHDGRVTLDSLTAELAAASVPSPKPPWLVLNGKWCQLTP